MRLYLYLLLLLSIPLLTRAQHDTVSKRREDQTFIYNRFIEGWIGKPFTLDSFQTIDGKVYQKRDFEGKKAFYRTSFHYCSPCRAELPVFVRMSLSQLNVLFVYITYDDSLQIRESFKGFDRHNVLIVQRDKEEIKKRKWAFAYPTNFFVDAKGIVKRVYTGGKVSETERTEREWLQYLSEL